VIVPATTASASTISGGFVSNGGKEMRMMSRSRITTDGAEQRKRLAPIHPGEILGEDLQDAGISLNELARSLRVPMNRISAIVNGKRSITADTAIRLARYFGTSSEYWMNLQSAYDLAVAERTIGARVNREVLPRHAA
jgi:antitoxin HigA-1